MKNKRDGKLTKKRAKRTNYEAGTNKQLKEHLDAAMARLGIPHNNFQTIKSRRRKKDGLAK